MNEEPKRKPLTARDVLMEIKLLVFDQQRWVYVTTTITTAATIMICIATVANWLITQSMLSQMQIQTEQAQKTISEMIRSNDIYQNSLVRQDTAIKIQKEAILLQGNDFNLQSDYYKKTVRPFVYPEAILLTDFSQTDSTYSIVYPVKNVGALPAKEVRHHMDLGDNKNMNYKVNFDPEGVVTALFPDQVTYGRFRVGRISISQLQRFPYAYVFVEFKDAADRKYHFRGIYYIDHKSFVPDKYSIVSILVDFD